MMGPINTKAPMILAKVIKNIHIIANTVLSIVSISLEKLFTIHLIGVVLK